MTTPTRRTRLAEAPILIVSAGSTSLPLRETLGDFQDWIAAGLGGAVPVRHVEARTDADLPAPQGCAGVVVSGSHAMVTERAPWSERLGAWMRDCVARSTPLLGICFGHQLLADALGGRVGFRAQGLEIGTHRIERTGPVEDLLFDGVPPAFDAHLVHRQSVLALPPGAVLLARSAAEPHQAYRVGRCAWGVQFHPEFSAVAMQGYVRELSASGEAAAQAAEVRETPVASALLARFARVAGAVRP